MHLGLTYQNTVWIHCPAGYVSGGPEALHQLSRALLDLGLDARMVYYPETKNGQAVPQPFASYSPVVSPHADAQRDDVVLVPEAATKILRRFKNARRVVWWLSVDYYRQTRTAWQTTKDAVRGGLSLGMKQMEGIAHLCQSFYAHTYLQTHGIGDAAFVTDYIREVAQRPLRDSEIVEREDIVLYDPRKGGAAAKRLMETGHGNFKWMPIRGLKPSQVREVMRSAKLYVDFGHHPGRDRMPREAAMSGCCVLTGRRGSAANDYDVPIPAFYKVDEQQTGWEHEAILKIEDIVSDYDAHASVFAPYREWISGQQAQFMEEVRAAFL